ncbi:MAG: UvrB/UvrC motif-containing protein [Firmicutes bacterium]|nr:UvrB/UvrC motif-containing protein [Bacillota bacterium]
MLCERCQQRPATVHLTEITNGQKKDSHICEVCAGEMQSQGFGFPPQLNLHNLLAGLLKHGMGAGHFTLAEPAGKNCEKCDLAEGQFVKQGLLGCGDCYRSFEGRLEPLLRRIHGNTRHTGKVPERTGGRARLAKEIDAMKQKLREAVGREEFERAAEIRDKVRELEKLMEQGGEG